MKGRLVPESGRYRVSILSILRGWWVKSASLGSQKGSMLVFSTFILLMVSVILISYWRLIQINSALLQNRESGMRAYYAARGGLEDAVSEIKPNGVWGDSESMDEQWVQTEEGFYKSSSAQHPLIGFDYPVTISVSLVGDPLTETVNITSRADISIGQKRYQQTLLAEVIRSLSGEIFIKKIMEI